MNSLKHGFTGQTLLVSAEEKEPYEAHIAGFHTLYVPIDAEEITLCQQLADLHWALNQIAVQQFNRVCLIDQISTEAAAQGMGALEIANLTLPHLRMLNNLGIYEGRKRRAAKEVESNLATKRKERLDRQARELPEAAKLYNHHKQKGQAWNPAENGFVCSIEEIESFLNGQQVAAQFKTSDFPSVTAYLKHRADELDRLIAEDDLLLAAKKKA
jgi:hypothetical protein